MQHQIVRVVDFEIVGRYTLRVLFDDETEQIINFEPTLEGHYFGPLRDPNLFCQVRLDSEIHTLVWPNDAAYDPATLYNWPQGDGEELAKRAALRRKRVVADATSS